MQDAMLMKAIQFASEKHAGQIRKTSGLPYVIHPVSVAFLLRSYKESKKLEELLVASLLHDTLEDTDTSFEELAREFSPLVAQVVYELTSDTEEIQRVGKNEYLKSKMKGISSYALVIKLVDRLSNIMDSPTEKYKEDTLELLTFLERNRQLTDTQRLVVAAIRKEILA